MSYVFFSPIENLQIVEMIFSYILIGFQDRDPPPPTSCCFAIAQADKDPPI
jgi:hypothetical protein